MPDAEDLQLALAAWNRGQAELALHHLERAGEKTRLEQKLARASSVEGFRLELFGHPRVWRFGPGEDEVELSWPLRRAFEVVAFLALQTDLRAGKEELIEAIWPEATPASLRKNFHPTLSAARRVLENGRDALHPPLVFEAGLYRLGGGLEWQIDVHDFEQQLETARDLGARGGAEAVFERLLAAWRLYRGPLLASFQTGWAQTRRDELHLRYLRLLREIGALGTRLGRLTEALDAYRTVLLEDPFEEQVHVGVMELYALQGRRDLVRKQYVRLQDHLKELSVEPLPETQERYHELMKR